MTRPEDLLTDTLRDRAERGDLAVTPLSDVVSTAGRLRRNRRIRYAAVTTVVVAVLATPFVLDAARPHESTNAPIDTPTTSPAPTVRLANVALGDPPAVPWLDGSDYVAADGTRTTLPITSLTNATPYDGGFLVSSLEDGVGRLTLLDADLHEVWRRCGWPTFAVDPDRTLTAYVSSGCGGTSLTVHLGRTDGTGPQQTAPLPGTDAAFVGVLGESVVAGSVNVPPPVVVDFAGPPAPYDTLHSVGGVEPGRGLVSGQLAGGYRLQATGAVVDAATGEVRWRAPGWQLLSFSPDGSMVLGVGLGTSGSGWAVFDSDTGDRLHEFGMPAGFRFSRAVWEDDEHLLMATTQGRTEAILRTTLDGAIQRASEAAPHRPNTADHMFHLAP